MIDTIFQKIKTLLQKGITEKGHAFRYATVATVDQNGAPQQRIMVFRELGNNLELYVYTDQRSSKIKQLAYNKHINILFYEPKDRIQITIHGIAEVLTEITTKKRWNSVQKGSINDYCTTAPPGTVIPNPAVVSYDYDTPYFSVIKVVPKHIEYLRLDQPNHIKAIFSLEKKQWKGTFIVP